MIVTFHLHVVSSKICLGWGDKRGGAHSALGRQLSCYGTRSGVTQEPLGRRLSLRTTSMVIFPIEACDKNGLHPNRFPRLRTLILDGFSVQSECVMDFWRCHLGLEILGLGRHLDGEWLEGFTEGI